MKDDISIMERVEHNTPIGKNVMNKDGTEYF